MTPEITGGELQGSRHEQDRVEGRHVQTFGGSLAHLHTTLDFVTEKQAISSSSEFSEKGRRMAVDVPPAFGWVVLVAVAYCALNFWMVVQVGKARKRYNVPYPTLYASESENKNARLFNCFQRGHQNSLESMPMFFLLIILGGLQHPVAATILGVIYCLARYAYFVGYSSGDPARRLTYGKYNFPALMGLMVCAASFGLQLLLGGKKLASQA